MAYKDTNIVDRSTAESQENGTQTLQFTGETVQLPHESYVRDADLSRDGADLVMDGPEGTLIIESYFSGLESPDLIGPSGAKLTPELVNSFTNSGNEYAQSASMSDVSPIGAVEEISGDATITRADGTKETLSIGSPVYQGDIIETNADAAVNVAFIDESSFAVSEETRLAIDEYVFDPSSQGGVQNFSVLKGVFVYTSGLIGREDPDDVSIETPVGSIGIRGTIIAGDVDKGEITVVEGAIVLRNPLGEEMTLASQFETGKFMPDNKGIVNLGQKTANDVTEKFSIVSKVAPNLFSSINDAAAETPKATPVQDSKPALDQPVKTPKADSERPAFDADGATDQNGDNEVDGTVDEGAAVIEETPVEEPVELVDMTGMNASKTTMQMTMASGMGQNTPASTMGNAMGANTMNMGNNTNMAMGADDTGELSKKEMAKEELRKSKKGMKNVKNSEDYDLADDTAIDNTNPVTYGGGSSTANPAPYVLSLDDIDFPQEALAGSISSHIIFGAGDIFRDPGDSLTYSITNVGGTGAAHISGSPIIDATNGVLDINLQTSFTGFLTQDFYVEITATDSAGNATSTTLNFTVYGQNAQLIGGDINTAGAGGDAFTYTGGSSPFNITVNDVNVFADHGDNTTTITSNFVELHTASGNDVVTLTATNGDGNALYLGAGNDTVNIASSTQQENFEAYGMSGNDTFNISNAMFMAMQSMNRNVKIDGGSNPGDYDTIGLATSGNIDFGAILDNGNDIRNIEKIDVNNGGGANTVTLRFQDVIDMTDDNNRLIISGDGADSVILQGFSVDTINGDTTPDAPDITIGSDNYQVHQFSDTSGHSITLLIDTDIVGGAGVGVS